MIKWRRWGFNLDDGTSVSSLQVQNLVCRFREEVHRSIIRSMLKFNILVRITLIDIYGKYIWKVLRLELGT